MPLFKSSAPPPAPAPADPPARKGSIFSRRRSYQAETTPPPATKSRGFFGGGRSSVDSSANNNNARDTGSVRSGTTSNSNGGGGGFFKSHNFDVHKDPTIIAAREKVTHAERAEAEADRALLQARNMVREAKEHVQFLEREAAEEAKRAKQKQAVSNDVSKSASGLGRHGL
ncbi:hypothetical protein DFH06DRAFT_1164168 [Mycena polygramma]|nr:hypothetical protein DFH06DRAFT_1164168 [Mycena polygramma]